MRQLPTIVTVILIGTSCIGTDYEPFLEPSVRILEDVESLYETGSHQFTAEYLDERGQIVNDTAFRWASSNPSVITISESGLAQGIAEGIADVAVELGGLRDEFTLVVFGSQEAIEIVGNPDTLEVGRTAILGVRYTDPGGNRQQGMSNVSWSSSDESVLIVSSSGEIRGLSPGETTVMARGLAVVDSIALTIRALEEEVAEELSIMTFPSTLDVGATFQLEASYFDGMGQPDPTVNITWSVADQSILSITGDGLIQGLAEGVTTVTATARGLSDEVVVEVLSSEVDITRFGTLRGTGYDISGEFSLSVEDDSLLLTVTNASIDPNAPGPYFYLSNQDRSVAGGVNLGVSQDGDFVINISRDFPEVALFTYDYFVVWCEPFSVTLGVGQFE